MTEYTIEVRITPRVGLLDPQGNAIHTALRSLDFKDLDDVRVGRLIRLRLRASDEASARAGAEEMCRRLLANPVTEDFEIALDGGR